MPTWPDQSAFATLLDAVPDAIYLIDPATSDILYCNRAGHEDLGYARADLLGHSVLSLQKDVTGLPQWSDIAETIRHNSPYVFLGRHRHQDGHEVSVEVHTTTLELEGRELFISTARNISQRVQAADELMSRDAQVRFALNEVSDGLWDWQIPTSEVYFSPQLNRMLGYGPSEMQPTLESWSDQLHPDDKPLVMKALEDHIQGLRERYEAEYRLKNRNGHYLWVHDRGRVCERDAQGQATRIVGMVRNITDQKAVEADLLSRATHDSLTGLGNRRECEDRLLSLIHTCQRLNTSLGVCLLDVDHFKEVNDTYGHAVGDQVLMRITKHMRKFLRASDGLYRWGGEEFVLLAPGLNADGMRQLCDKLRALVATLNWTELLGTHQITCSFGVAEMPSDGTTSAALLTAADSAMYQAKAQGRNQVCVTTLPHSPRHGEGNAPDAAHPSFLTGEPPSNLQAF